MCQKTWNRLPWLVPPDPAEHNISHVSLSSELLAVKMPQLHRPDPRILRVLRTTDRNLTRCQDNHQRNGRQNCIGPVLAFTHSARRPRPQAPTFPIPPYPLKKLFAYLLCAYGNEMANKNESWSGAGKVREKLRWHRQTLSNTNAHICAAKERLNHTNAKSDFHRAQPYFPSTYSNSLMQLSTVSLTIYYTWNMIWIV